MNKSLKIILAFTLLSISGRAYTQVDTIVWQQLSPLPSSTGLDDPGYFLIDSDFYVIGGSDVGNDQISRVWKYHIPTDTWIQLGNLPFGGACAGASFVLNGKGYFLVGTDSLNNSNCDTILWEYDPSADSWARRAGLPDTPRYNSTWFNYGDKGYVGFTYGCGTFDNHFWQYDPVINEWIQMATLPGAIAIGRGIATSSDGMAYFVGGQGYNDILIGDVWKYNSANNIWDSIGQMPGPPRAGAVIWSFDSTFICGGGVDSNNILLNDFYLYNVSRNIWTQLVFQNSFDSAGGTFGAFIFNKKGYCFGGLSSQSAFTFNNNMWSFDASRFFPTDTTTGIAAIKNTVTFSLYPNPVSHEQGFSVSTSESGSISFYDALGRTLDERKLVRGINQIKFPSDDEVVFYHATLSSGATENGKVVFIR